MVSAAAFVVAGFEVSVSGRFSAVHRGAVFLGTAMRYDIAEVVDPLVHIVAKVRKDAVAQLK